MSDLGDPYLDDDSSIVGSDDSENEEQFDSIKKYFDPLEYVILSSVEKRAYLSQKERYEHCKQNECPIGLPHFMKVYAEKLLRQTKSKKATGKRKNTDDSSTSQTKRTSSRIRGKENNDPNKKSGSGNATVSNSFLLPASKQPVNAANLSAPSTSGTSQNSTRTSFFRMERNPAITLVSKQSLSASSSAGSQDDRDGGPSCASNDDLGNDDIDTGDFDFDEVSSDLSEVIQNTVKSTLPTLPESTVGNIVKLIIDNGAEKVEHLGETEVAWLVEIGVKQIQAKVLVNALKKLNAEEQQQGGNKKRKTRQAQSLMREQEEAQPISSRPLLSTKCLATEGALGLEIDFGKFNDTLLMSLENEQRPSAIDRHHMVQVLSTDIREKWDIVKKNNPTIKQKTPGRAVYKAVVDALFVTYDFAFKDTLNGALVGDGKFSLLDQIETCIENKYRPVTSRSGRALPVRGNRAAACILATKFAPPMTKQDKAEAETARLSLLAVYNDDRERDWDAIKLELLKDASLAAQRAMITAKTRDICLIAEKWPLLFEFPGLIAHLDEITGSDLKHNFEIFITNGLDSLIDFLRVMSPQRIKILKIDKQLELAGNGIQKRLFALIMMLVVHWGEDATQLHSCVEEFTQPHEVADLLPDLPSTPHIVALGSSPFEASKFYLMMERQCVFKTLQNPLEALMALCASYFVFGVLYPPQLGITLTFVERIIANLIDADGVNKAQTEKGCTKSCVAKLKKLEDQVAKYDKEIHEDENC